MKCCRRRRYASSQEDEGPKSEAISTKSTWVPGGDDASDAESCGSFNSGHQVGEQQPDLERAARGTTASEGSVTSDEPVEPARGVAHDDVCIDVDVEEVERVLRSIEEDSDNDDEVSAISLQWEPSWTDIDKDAVEVRYSRDESRERGVDGSSRLEPGDLVERFSGHKGSLLRSIVVAIRSPDFAVKLADRPRHWYSVDEQRERLRIAPSGRLLLHELVLYRPAETSPWTPCKVIRVRSEDGSVQTDIDDGRWIPVDEKASKLVRCTYEPGQDVLYRATPGGEWVDAAVTVARRGDGAVSLDLAENIWLDLEMQACCLRRPDAAEKEESIAGRTESGDLSSDAHSVVRSITNQEDGGAADGERTPGTTPPQTPQGAPLAVCTLLGPTPGAEAPGGCGEDGAAEDSDAVVKVPSGRPAFADIAASSKTGEVAEADARGVEDPTSILKEPAEQAKDEIQEIAYLCTVTIGGEPKPMSNYSLAAQPRAARKDPEKSSEPSPEESKAAAIRHGPPGDVDGSGPEERDDIPEGRAPSPTAESRSTEAIDLLERVMVDGRPKLVKRESGMWDEDVDQETDAAEPRGAAGESTAAAPQAHDNTDGVEPPGIAVEESGAASQAEGKNAHHEIVRGAREERPLAKNTETSAEPSLSDKAKPAQGRLDQVVDLI